MSNVDRLLLVAAVAAALLAVGLGSASWGRAADVSTPTEILLPATLDVKNVLPAPRKLRPGAAGTFVATLTGDRLSWRLTLQKLTSLAYGAHVHFGPPGTREIRFGEELMRKRQTIFLCGPCVSGSYGVEPSLASGIVRRIRNGDAFLVVHTGLNQYGEIAGRLKIVPIRRDLGEAREKTAAQPTGWVSEVIGSEAQCLERVPDAEGEACRPEQRRKPIEGASDYVGGERPA